MAGDERSQVLEAARDLAAQSLRIAVGTALKGALTRNGDRLRALAMFKTHQAEPTAWAASRDDQLIALAHLCETAAALLGGVIQLVESGNNYSASALNRQLVEVEYLAWAFANDPEEARTWQVSTKTERLKRWQPRHLRDRSNDTFRGADYGEHCEVGGHPTPDGMKTLLHGEQETISGIVLFEAATHGSSVWRYLLEAVVIVLLDREFEPAEIVDHATATNLVRLQDEWHRIEALPVAWRNANHNEGSTEID